MGPGAGDSQQPMRNPFIRCVALAAALAACKAEQGAPKSEGGTPAAGAPAAAGTVVKFDLGKEA